MPNFYLSLLIIVALYTSNALAQAENETYLDAEQIIVPAAEMPPPQEAETQTGLWLQLQASGAWAGNRYVLPGQTATLIHQRYLNSFRHPIPERFKTEGMSDGGSASGR